MIYVEKDSPRPCVCFVRVCEDLCERAGAVEL